MTRLLVRIKDNLTSAKILFSNRFRGDTGNDAVLSVNGTDFLMAMYYKKAFYSFKFKKMGLRYEVGINIKTGDICWWHGPFPPGLYNDDMIFKDALLKSLGKGERVEADSGYKPSAPVANIPEYTVPSRRYMAAKVRSRHETFNRRFKQFKILKEAYRHDILDHQAVFSAVVVMTQLAFENGDPLFPTEYDDDGVH